MRDPVTGEFPPKLTEAAMKMKVSEFEKNRPDGWPNFTVEEEPSAIKNAKERYAKKHGYRIQPQISYHSPETKPPPRVFPHESPWKFTLDKKIILGVAIFSGIVGVSGLYYFHTPETPDEAKKRKELNEGIPAVDTAEKVSKN